MDFITALKKVDLHCHLDGSLSEQMIRIMAADVGVSLPTEEYTLTQRLRVKDDCKSLAEYLTHFDIPLACLVTQKNLEQAAMDVMRQAAEENVIYIELRFAPLLSVCDNLNCRQVIEGVVNGIKKGQEQYHIRGNAILCSLRHNTPEDNISMMTVGREFLGQGVCAVDLAGDEAAHSVLEQKEYFQAAQKLKMPYTIHAGECGSVQSIRDAISLGARRIGHGVAMKEDPETRTLCKRLDIGIEMCPISNLQTKAVTSWTDYPLKRFLEDGLKVTVNTDNRTVSNTSITRELCTLKKKVGLSEKDMVKIMENAVKIAFLPEEDKEILLKEFH